MTVPILPEALSGTPCVVVAAKAAPSRVRILFIEQLSALIGKSTTTIRTFATRKGAQHLIPRPFKMPGSRRLCWYEADVLAWIESSRPAPEPPSKRRRGAPTKVERAAWAAGKAVAQ